MRAASAGPTRGSCSSSVADAVLRLTRPVKAALGARRPWLLPGVEAAPSAAAMVARGGEFAHHVGPRDGEDRILPRRDGAVGHRRSSLHGDGLREEERRIDRRGVEAPRVLHGESADDEQDEGGEGVAFEARERGALLERVKPGSGHGGGGSGDAPSESTGGPA